MSFLESSIFNPENAPNNIEIPVMIQTRYPKNTTMMVLCYALEAVLIIVPLWYLLYNSQFIFEHLGAIGGTIAIIIAFLIITIITKRLNTTAKRSSGKIIMEQRTVSLKKEVDKITVNIPDVEATLENLARYDKTYIFSVDDIVNMKHNQVNTGYAGHTDERHTISIRKATVMLTDSNRYIRTEETENDVELVFQFHGTIKPQIEFATFIMGALGQERLYEMERKHIIRQQK